MRCIDHPTMVKDGSGWGSMAGVSAAYLAMAGYTGAPAITVEQESQSCLWSDIGSLWYMNQQYVKPYPVCRWAQPAIVAALALKDEHGVETQKIEKIIIETFHEATRLATSEPGTTEEAQYSLPFPVAAALVCEDLGVNEIEGTGLTNQTVVELSRKVELLEKEEYNNAFPANRYCKVKLVLNGGQILESPRTEASGDPENPLSDVELSEKFDRMAQPVLGTMRTTFLKEALTGFGTAPDLSGINALVYSPGERSTDLRMPDFLNG